MAKKTVVCDVCGIEMEAEVSIYDVGTDHDLCAKHYRRQQLDDAKRERDKLAQWLESTHLKKLRELDEKIAALEALK